MKVGSINQRVNTAVKLFLRTRNWTFMLERSTWKYIYLHVKYVTRSFLLDQIWRDIWIVHTLTSERRNWRVQFVLLRGAILNEHSLYKLRIIGNSHRVVSYFFPPYHAYITQPFYLVQKTLSSDELCLFDYSSFKARDKHQLNIHDKTHSLDLQFQGNIGLSLSLSLCKNIKCVLYLI